MWLSMNRLRRCNAGSKMSSLIKENDLNNEFYDHIYGGLNDEEEDNSYQSESSQTDSVDSDFSIDENDEPISDDQNEDQINDKRNKTKFDYNRKKRSTNEKIVKNDTNEETVSQEFVVPVIIDIPFTDPIISSRKLRSTKLKSKKDSEEVVENVEKNEKQFERKAKKRIQVKELSQKEMLAEALITEEINLKSLEEYHKLELEKAKKSKSVKHSIKGPFIRYNSVSMPIIEVMDEQNQDLSIDENRNYSRTFISFSDEENYNSFFNLLNSPSAEVPKVSVCPVTQLPARYIDPVSELPFATSEAFTAIRNQYLKQLELHSNTNQTEIAQWIEWKQNYEQKWNQWQRKYCSYDNKVIQNETEVQSTETQLEISKVVSVPKVLSSRKRRKSKK